MAEALLNPWGDDDDDFQISYLIDRNFQVPVPALTGPDPIKKISA